MGIYRAKSYPEQYIGYICKQNFNHVDLNKKIVNGLEADIKFRLGGKRHGTF